MGRSLCLSSLIWLLLQGNRISYLTWNWNLYIDILWQAVICMFCKSVRCTYTTNKLLDCASLFVYNIHIIYIQNFVRLLRYNNISCSKGIFKLKRLIIFISASEILSLILHSSISRYQNNNNNTGCTKNDTYCFWVDIFPWVLTRFWIHFASAG